jgi:hypothetical protein
MRGYPGLVFKKRYSHRAVLRKRQQRQQRLDAMIDRLVDRFVQKALVQLKSRQP